jgi:hypothetical protein
MPTRSQGSGRGSTAGAVVEEEGGSSVDDHEGDTRRRSLLVSPDLKPLSWTRA